MRRLLLVAVGLWSRGGRCSWSPPTSSTGGHNRAMDFLERVEEQIRRRAHSGRRRGHLPRLRRRGLLRAVARAARARLRGLRTAREPWAAGRRVGRGREVLRRVFGAEVVEAPPASTEAELRDLRYSFATDRLRAWPRPPIRSRPSSTVWCRAASPAGSSRSGRTGSFGRCSASGATRRRRTAKPSGCRSAADQPGGDARADPRPDHPSAPAARRARGEEPARARRGPLEPARCLDGECRRLGAGRPRRRCAGRARVRPCLARTRPCRTERRGSLGPLENQLVGLGPQGPWLARRGPARQPVEEASGCLRGRQGSALAPGGLASRGARRRGRRCAGDRRGGRSGS